MARIKLKDDWEFQHTNKHLSPKTIKKFFKISKKKASNIPGLFILSID